VECDPIHRSNEIWIAPTTFMQFPCTRWLDTLATVLPREVRRKREPAPAGSAVDRPEALSFQLP
jgi:hypothetical protein